VSLEKMKLQLPTLNLPPFHPQVRAGISFPEIFDPFRKKWFKLTPEEWVRQWFLNFLTVHKGFPFGRIAVETEVKYNHLSRRADAVVFNDESKPLVIIECKAPTIEIDENVFYQACMYNNPLNAKWLFLTNGIQHIAADISQEVIQFDESIPNYSGL
jgi:hypothetical protein